MSPYPKSPTSVISTSTSSSAPSGSTQRHGTSSEMSRTSFKKGKSTLAQMKADLDGRLDELNGSTTDQQFKIAALKSERKMVRMHTYMRDKEIAHIEAEGERERMEADKIHTRLMERKRLDIDVLKEEGEVLHLRVELMKLQATFNPGGATEPSGTI